MNPKLSAIFERRSVRLYTDAPVGDETVRDLLEAAMAAPSAVARDPWHFIVVRDRQTLNRMADGMPNAQMLREAPLGVLVCGDMQRAHGGLESYMIQDCSAAIQNLLLAASMLGLGACWLGIHPREERVQHVRDLFGLPGHIVPVSAIAIGYPSETLPPRTRYREEAVHGESFRP
jgi:nitroreductase